jgi:signal transduction histidine kinase
VLSHEGLLHQAFVNLIGNAIKYSSPRRNPVVRIEARPADQPGFSHISVSDNGVGFPAGHEHELFKPFRRLHHANQFPGEGMGLANVKRIVDRHGGFVQAALVPQGGACFTLTLMTARE